MKREYPLIKEFESWLLDPDKNFSNLLDGLIDLRKYATRQDLLAYQDILIEMLSIPPMYIYIFEKAVFILTEIKSERAKPILYRMMRYKQPYEKRAIVIDSYCRGYEHGSKNKRLLERLFNYVANKKLRGQVRMAAIRGIMYVYYTSENIPLKQIEFSSVEFGDDNIEYTTPWQEIRFILESVKSDYFEKFLVTDLGQFVKEYRLTNSNNE